MAEEVNIAAFAVTPPGQRRGLAPGTDVPRTIQRRSILKDRPQGAEIQAGRTREDFRRRIDREPTARIRPLVQRSRDRNDRAARQSDADLDRTSRDIEGGRLTSEQRTDALKKRRVLAARSIAAHIRTRRLALAKLLLDQAEKSTDRNEQNRLREIADKIRRVKIRWVKGEPQIDCGSLRGFDGYPAGASDQFGARVPQWPTGIVPTQNPDLLRSILTQAGASPSMQNAPGPIQIPSFVTLPGVAAAQPRLPSFYPEPPRMLPIGVPGRGAPPRPVILIPPAQVHPLRHQHIARPRAFLPPRPRVIGGPAPAARVLGPDVVVFAGDDLGVVPPRFRRPLNAADSGWLGDDIMVADIEGLCAIVETVEGLGDSNLGEADGFGIEIKLPKIKLFSTRLHAHRTRTLKKITGGLLGFVVGVALLPVSLVGGILGSIIGTQVSDETALAKRLGRSGSSAAQKRRAAQLMAEWRTARTCE